MEIDLINFLEGLMILFGIFCVSLSFFLAFRFKRVNIELSRALYRQLFAEALVGMVTCAFAITSWLGIYSLLSPPILLILRGIIFFSGAVTSINLYRKVKKLEGSDK